MADPKMGDDEAKKAIPPQFLQNMKDKKKDGDGDKDDEADKAKKAMPMPMSDKAEKSVSVLTEEELRKSLSGLEAYISATSGRKDELMRKSLAGEIDAAGEAELAALLQPQTAPNFVKSLDPAADESLQKSLDVSDYLTQLHDGIFTYCKELSESVQKSSTTTEKTNHIFAKSLLSIGRCVEQLMSQGDMAKSQSTVRVPVPVRGPRAMGVQGAQPLEKSMAGQGASQLGKNDVLDILDEMHKSAFENGREGKALCGEDLNSAITKFEQLNRISPALQQELLQFRAARRNGVSTAR